MSKITWLTAGILNVILKTFSLVFSCDWFQVTQTSPRSVGKEEKGLLTNTRERVVWPQSERTQSHCCQKPAFLFCPFFNDYLASFLNNDLFSLSLQLGVPSSHLIYSGLCLAYTNTTDPSRAGAVPQRGGSEDTISDDHRSQAGGGVLVTYNRGHTVHKENIVLLERRLNVARDSSFFEKSKKSRFFMFNVLILLKAVS